MSFIARPSKSGGTQQYTTEVAAGFTFAKASEVDGDLNPIYTVINGGLDDFNIAPLAGIQGSKLGSGIDGSKLVDLSVPVSKLANTSITTGKLAVGASIFQFVAGSAHVSWNDTGPLTDDKLIAELTWSPRSPSSELLALVRLAGSVATTMASGSGYVSLGATWRLMSGGTAGSPLSTSGTQLDLAAESYLNQPQSLGAGYVNTTFPIAGSLQWAGITPDTRLRVICRTVQTIGATSHWTADVTGSILLVEFA